jgi:hypothetical protein
MQFRNSVCIAPDVCVLRFQNFRIVFMPLSVVFLVLMCISGLTWSISFTTVIYISIRITSNLVREFLYRARP